MGLTGLLVSSFLPVDFVKKFGKLGTVILLKCVELVGVAANTTFKVSSVTIIPLTEIGSLLVV
jgi:hypothetical protein